MNVDYSACRVLLADDESPVAEVLAREIRRRLACAITVVSDGDQVVDALAREPFDVLITDMMMPGRHGLDLVAYVGEHHPDVDVLVTTAFAVDFPFIDVVRAGATDFIEKPHPADEMQAKLMRIFRERALKSELAREKQQIQSDMEAMARLRDERAIAESKFQHLFEYCMNGMLVVAPYSFVIQDVNQAFSEVCGRAREDLAGRPIFEFFDDVERERLRQGIVLVTEIGKATLGDIMLRRPNGSAVCLDVSLSHIPVAHEPLIHFVCQDVTEQRELQRRLTEIAQTDQLTGLYNKRSFDTRLGAAVGRAQKDGFPLTLLFLDLDNFKQCNDTHGHQVGDELLAVLGKIIVRHTRTRLDAAFRYGGDEFAIVLSQADTTIGARVAERIRSEYCSNDGHGTSLSVGIGAFVPGMTATELLRTADDALYRAKQAGKNQIHIR
jgi:diguanylate cyclase (GGDEF)-like protein/PAS domain S-box-containing protein